MFVKNIYAKYFTNIPKMVAFSLLQGKNIQNLHNESEGSVYQTKNDTMIPCKLCSGELAL